MMRNRIKQAMVVAALCCWAVSGAFARERPPRISELLETANATMAEAQAAYVEGESRRAIELYRKALEELASVEREHPDRARTAEFAPVRFRRALCETEIDRILLEEINATGRAVMVTDTRALEERRAERRRSAEEAAKAAAAPPKPAGGDAAPTAEPVEPAMPDAQPVAAATEGEPPLPKPEVVADAPRATVNVRSELEWAKDMLQLDRFDDVEKALMPVLRQEPRHREARFLMAVMRFRQGRFSDARVVMDDLLADNPEDEAVLLLLSGAYMGTGDYGKAMETLDRAMKLNPRRPDGYLNMAWLLLDMNPTESAEAELYYRQAVRLGAARDRGIERRLGIRPE